LFQGNNKGNQKHVENLIILHNAFKKLFFWQKMHLILIIMINKRFLFILLLGIFIMPLTAQSFDSAFKQMQTAINTGNYSNLSVLFSDTVDLTVRDTDGIFSKAQAKGVLKSFFENDKPKSFQIKHQGSSNNGTVYAIGLYVSSKASYRVYALFKDMQGSAKIVQLQIEEEL